MSERITAPTVIVDRSKLKLKGRNERIVKGEVKRKQQKKKLVLRDEVRAGLRFRLNQAVKHHGGIVPTARFLGVTRGRIRWCLKIGYATPGVANIFHRSYIKKRSPFRASYLRPDLGLGTGKFVKDGVLKKRYYRVDG